MIQWLVVADVACAGGVAAFAVVSVGAVFAADAVAVV